MILTVWGLEHMFDVVWQGSQVWDQLKDVEGCCSDGVILFSIATLMHRVDVNSAFRQLRKRLYLQKWLKMCPKRVGWVPVVLCMETTASTWLLCSISNSCEVVSWNESANFAPKRFPIFWNHLDCRDASSTSAETSPEALQGDLAIWGS